MGFGSGTPQRKLARHRVAVDEDGRQDGDDMLARQLVFVCVGPDVCVCVCKLLFYTVYFDCAGGARDHCKPGTNKDACFDL